MGSRDTNLDRVLALVRERRSVSRTELAAATGLSRSAISTLVSTLIDANQVVERVGPPKGPGSGSGRPSVELLPVLPAGYLLAIDFGHNHIAVAVAETDGRIRSRRRIEIQVDAHAPEALDNCAQLVAATLHDLGAPIERVLAAAAGIPGPLDSTPQRNVMSPTILSSWVDLSPELELERRIGLPVQVDNDANLGALGELRFGVGGRLGDFLYVKASHGVGSSLVLSGRPYRGATGIAGEIGHTQIPGLTQWCRCGNHGCLETEASIDVVRDKLSRIRPELAEPAVAQSDPAGRRILSGAGRTIGRVIADLCNCLNPAGVIIGGELSEYGDPVMDGIRESIDRFAQPAVSDAVTVVRAETGSDAELLGALAMATDAVLGVVR
ncbi:ROK family transcriptional regulator [Nakamurella lactea]|uniref:ROK family transcriptional regulator n=1 Tax=Nakamurella lactea TaxID=459515 RepID=UPI000416A7FC|nr:ROK family transcriptional regulator [Nakamurella lactea]